MRKKGEFDFNLIRAMEVFVAVAEIGQVTKAAGLLGMTQSAASQQLRALEGAFGSKLVDRASRPIRLTQAGIALHKRAAQILSEIEELKAQVRRLEHIPVPLLRIGLLSSLAGPLSPAIVRHCKERLEVPELILRTGLASDHQALLRNREVDLIVTSDALYDVDGLERHVLMTEPFYLVLPRGFEGPAKDLAALAKELPMVRFTAAAPVGRRVEQHLRRLRLDIPRGLEVDRAEIVLSIVSAGLGFAILTPTLLLDREAAADGIPDPDTLPGRPGARAGQHPRQPGGRAPRGPSGPAASPPGRPLAEIRPARSNRRGRRLTPSERRSAQYVPAGLGDPNRQ
jgi:DNA-binding transcriptional LysR family regulator